MISRGLIPAGLLATGALIALTLGLGWPRATVMAVAPLGLAAALSVLEAFVGRWHPRWKTAGRDATYFLLSAAIGGLAPMAVAAWLPARFLALPFFVALPLAVVGLDLVTYLVHRAFHAVPLLWRIHSVHHAPRGLYALVAMVDGPVFTAVVRSARAAAALLAGFSLDVVFAIALIDAWQGFSAHLGVDTKNPWLSRWVVTPEVHRMHHSASHAGNYALTLTLWDRAFGTFVAPTPETPKLGLGDQKSVGSMIGRTSNVPPS